MAIQTGDEIGILGFPGILETVQNPFTLIPNPTFKIGIVSAIRSYNENRGISNDWNWALIGRMVQHNLETAPGNSGSPIFNRRGEVVAIHNSGIPGGDAFDFGVRADEIRVLMKSLSIGDVIVPNVNTKTVGGSFAVAPYRSAFDN